MELKLVFCVFVGWLHAALAQEGTQCLTPDQHPGVCINIYSCDPLISLLRTRGRDARVIRYLQASGCGYVGSQPLVCCQAGPQPIPTAPPPTERITERPVTNRPNTERPVQNGRYQLPKWPYCGLRNESKTDRIVGGRPAALGEFPWIVALGYRNSKNPNNPQWLCGGSLITQKHVLTAGHCLRDDLYLVRAGDLDLYSEDDGTQPINVPIARAIRHEDYNIKLHTNDIAILILSQPIKGYLIAPICIPFEEPLRSKNYERYQPLVAGWGSVYFRGPSSPSLQVAQLTIKRQAECETAYAQFRGSAVIDNRILCVGDDDASKDSCEGDSGGPLVISNQVDTHLQMYQIGVVSYGHKCAEKGFPGVYTKVQAFTDWIQQNLVDA